MPPVAPVPGGGVDEDEEGVVSAVVVEEVEVAVDVPVAVVVVVAVMVAVLALPPDAAAEVTTSPSVLLSPSSSKPLLSRMEGSGSNGSLSWVRGS